MGGVRISVVLPEELWQELQRAVPRGRRSQIIAAALQRELRRRRRLQAVESLKKLKAELRARCGQMPPLGLELQAMREERDAELSGLR